MVPAATRAAATIRPCPPPAAAAPSVQIFGHERDPGTRAAVRFFKERRIAIHQVDLTRKPIAPRRAAPVRRAARRAGARRRDVDGPGATAGSATSGWTTREIVERLLADPALLRLPLVRFGNDVAAGRDEATWKRWFSSPSRAAT